MTTRHHGRSTRAGKRAKIERPRKPQKLQPILLDRLSHALEAQGVSLKRTAVLQIAAAAFGYHNAHELAAADLTVPAVEAVAQATLPDGETLMIVRDPVANALYGIEDQFLAQVVADERREFLGVSPYGHLLDLSALPDVEPLRLGRADLGEDAPLHFAIIEHKHGTSASVALTKDALYDDIAGFCQEYWQEAERRAGPITDYATSQEIVEAYFAGHDTETLYVETARLPRAEKSPPAEPASLDPLYPYADYRAYLAITGQQTSYPHWVASQKATASASRRFWETRDSVQMLAVGSYVVNDVHHVCADGRHLRPGTLARVENVVTVAGCVQLALAFEDGGRVVYTDRERGGSFPVLMAVCHYTADKAPAGLDWIPSGRLPGFGTTVEATVDARGEDRTIPAGTRLKTGVNYTGSDGRIRLVVHFDDTGSTILEALPHCGVFPIRIVEETPSTTGDLGPGDNLYIADDWVEAVNARAASGLSFDAWNAKARADKVHLREAWLTADQARTLKEGDRLTIQVHGRGDAWTEELGETYEGGYAPGTLVTVDEVIPYQGEISLMVYVSTKDHIEIVLPVRAGYVPLARAPEDPAAEPDYSDEEHLFPLSDFENARTQGAVGNLTYAEWKAKAATDQVHLRDRWLTIAEADALNTDDRLAVQIYGSGWAHDTKANRNHQGTYRLGTPIRVLAVDDHGPNNPWIYAVTDDGIDVTLYPRAGYLPVARIAPATAQTPVETATVAEPVLKAEACPQIGERPSLGEEIAFDGIECRIEVADIPEHQPLAAEGIIMIVDQYSETHTCALDGDRWVIVPDYELSDAQRDALTAA